MSQDSPCLAERGPQTAPVWEDVSTSRSPLSRPCSPKAETQSPSSSSPQTSPSAPSSSSPQTSPSAPSSSSPQTSPSAPSSSSPQTSPSAPSSSSPQTSPSAPSSSSPQTSPPSSSPPLLSSPSLPPCVAEAPCSSSASELGAGCRGGEGAQSGGAPRFAESERMQKLQSPSSSSPKEAGLSREGRPGGLSSEADSEHPQQRALSPSAFSSSTTVPSSRGAHRENEERTLAAPPSNAASDKQTGAGFLGRVSQWTSLASLRTAGAETTNEAHASGMEAAAAQAKSGVSAAARVASSWGRWISQATSGLVEELQAEMAVSEELKEFCGTISRDSQRWMEEHQTVFPHLTSSTSASSTSAGSAHSRSRLPSVRGCLAPVSAGEERELGRAPSFPSRQAETSVSLSSSNASQTTGSQPASRADSSLAAAQPPPPPPAAALSSAAGLASLQSSRPPSLEESSEPLDREKGSLEPQTSPAMESVYSRFSSLLSSTSLLVATASDTARNVARGLTGNSPEAAGERERSGQSGQEEQRWRELKTEREEAGGRESVLPLKPFFGTAGAEREPSCPLADLERRLPPVIARGSSELRRQYAALIRSPATFLEDPTGHLVSLSRVPVSPPSSSAARQLNASESETAAERAAACSSPCSFPLPLEASWEAGLAAEREKREGASPVQECLFSPSHREEDAAPDFAAFHVEAYDDLLDFFHNPQVMEMRRQLVPHRVEESLFWRRLLFRVQLLCQDCSRSDSASRARVCEGEAKESFSEISRDKKEFSTGMREAEPSSPRPVPPHEPPSSLGIPRGSEMRGLMAELDEEDIAWDDDETGDSQEATEGGNPLASVFSSLRGPTLSPESEPGSCLQNESPRAALLAVEVSSSSSPTSPSSSLASPPLSSLSETPRVSSAAPHPPQSSTSPEPHQTLEVASTLSSPLVSVPKTHSPLPPASPSDCPPAAVCSFSAASSTQSALQPCPNGGLPVHLGSAARPGSRAQTTDAEVKLERDALQDASSTNLGACLPRPSSDSGRSACTLERPAATETQLPLEHGFHVVVSEARFRGAKERPKGLEIRHLSQTEATKRTPSSAMGGTTQDSSFCSTSTRVWTFSWISWVRSLRSLFSAKSWEQTSSTESANPRSG